MVTTTIEDLHADVLGCALRRLDGRSLAAASCATAALRALATDPDTWRALCLAEWPSLALPLPPAQQLAALPPQRLFADAHPFPTAAGAGGCGLLPLPVPAGELSLVSAVDVYYRGAPLLSRVVETPASSSWFLASPFRVEAVERKKPAPEAAAAAPFSPAELELSWVVVDPSRGRAVNVSSRRPVAVDRHWYTGETLARFAVVLGGCKFEATVACSDSEGAAGGHVVSEVTLAVEDADGAAVSGEGALRLLAAAMEAPRKGGAREPEEAKRRYLEFVKRKKGRKESKARREALVDLCCSAASAVVVLTCLAAVALR
ncbi:hypothetical protein BDA96_06G080800 [Sorghum bicolor]|uniref:F-box domain-containing protein n=2 Tax=Sorghum bicolor TaxID=4558 RepID=A0A921UBC0_SORBI|nr:probable F-box protein At2g36090 [Sorghum bicolor]EES12134.1 hypothetical protein SORBI_3006G073400 [Sorghum bicolor]KAG0525717.1 hypothetical protein BDA96_06G080800 [Sorghum bicolor]|eukprot:XP_002447806.1 probable F-box protein At2g36090 [Sorghum bicolor]